MLKLLVISPFFILNTLVAQKQIVKPTMVETSCGQCQFKMKGYGCDLAIKYRGKTYFVEGTNIDQHGDAHADNGFCKKIRQAKVKGKFVKNRFVADYFILVD